ncbi:MAG: hypothetical protein KatS3mg032_2168 [Cyclobacteriaceae bacterium]|nr:MAG: hypothetical protein KatS3mg032_2168 [Cyclobacteriaceae bacterium]
MYALRWVTIYTLYSAFILIVASFFILQLPWVQTRLTRRVLESVTEQTGFKASIGRLEFYWFDRLHIKNLRITDPENNDMFNIASLRLNFTFQGLVQGHGYELDAALADSATVHLATIKENDSVNNLNINVFVHRLMPRSGKKPARTPAITVGEVLLKNGTFIYASDRDSITQGFDYNHFRVNIAGAEVQQLFIQDDTVSMQVQSLQATEAKTRLSIHQLHTFFRFSDRGLEFHGIELQAGKSYIADTVLFRFSGQDDLSDFADSVWAEIHLKKTVIHPEDLALFAPGTEKLLQHG